MSNKNITQRNDNSPSHSPNKPLRESSNAPSSKQVKGHSTFKSHWGTSAKVLPTSIDIKINLRSVGSQPHLTQSKTEISKQFDKSGTKTNIETKKQQHQNQSDSYNLLDSCEIVNTAGLRLGLLGSLRQIPSSQYFELRKKGYQKPENLVLYNNPRSSTTIQDIASSTQDISDKTLKSTNKSKTQSSSDSRKHNHSSISPNTTTNNTKSPELKDISVPINNNQDTKDNMKSANSSTVDNQQKHMPPQQQTSSGNLFSTKPKFVDTLFRKSSESQRCSIDQKAEQESKMLGEIAKLNSLSIRFTKFKNLLDSPNIDLDQLKKLSWSGIPEEVRAMTWKLLMGYLPLNTERREATVARKRKDYEEYVAQSFGKGEKSIDQQLHHQIQIDIQRTHASIALYQQPIVRESLKKILYCWAIRHPASGYVQGINDLVTPFFHVFLQSLIGGNVENADTSKLTSEVMSQVEADCFWCLTKLLDGIQDNYTFAQPGIQRQVNRLKELIARIDVPLSNHLTSQGVEFIQFAFRWMNCLLMREVSLRCTIRMWDTYMAEGQDGFSDFHLYVCAAFLVKWSDRLKKMEFADIMMFIQSLPNETQKWEEKDIELLLSEAFMWKSLFYNAPNHLAT